VTSLLPLSREAVVSEGREITGRSVGIGRICSGLGDIVEARNREKLAGRHCWIGTRRSLFTKLSDGRARRRCLGSISESDFDD